MNLMAIFSISIIGYFSLQSKPNCRGETLTVKTKNCSCGMEKMVKGRIIGGVEADEDEFPWQVAIYYKNRYQCGASLINDRYILTAAHCYKMATPSKKIIVLPQENITFVLGTIDLKGERSNLSSMIRRPIKTVIHGFYNPFTFFSDIAVSKLDSPITNFLFNLLPICLPPSDQDFNGLKGTVAGWGSTGEGKGHEDILRKTSVKVLTQEVCQDKLSATPFDYKVMICASSVGHDSCQGDSGGPLITKLAKNKYFQIGLVSFGIGCGDDNYPGVYTRINKFSSWIIFHSNDGLYCSQ